MGRVKCELSRLAVGSAEEQGGRQVALVKNGLVTRPEASREGGCKEMEIDKKKCNQATFVLYKRLAVGCTLGGCLLQLRR